MSQQETDTLSPDCDFQEVICLPQKIWIYLKSLSVVNNKPIEDILSESIIKEFTLKADKYLSQIE